MKQLNFSLKPFVTEDAPNDFQITGMIYRYLNSLSIRYELKGPLEVLSIPHESNVPVRIDRLWEDTCFELFLKTEHSDIYWEFNLYPSGYWNIYRFNAYRQGMQEEQAFNGLPFYVQRHPDILRLELEFELGKIIPINHAADIGICSVLKTFDNRVILWALAHPGLKPDFHRQDIFIINL